MNILYVVSRAIEINTSASLRNYATIMGFIKNGHKLTIVSAMPDFNHIAYDESLNIGGINKLYFQLGGLNNISSILNKYKNNKYIKKIKEYMYEKIYGKEIYDNYKSIIKFTEQVNINEFDLIISSSDPKSSHLFVDKLLKSKKKNIPWIQIWGDPFALDITRKNFSEEVVHEEERLLSTADKIIYVSKLTCEKQKEKYPFQQNKMIYIPIPYIKESISKKEFPKNYKEMKLCYCGDYPSYVRNLMPLYQAVKELNIKTTICGMSDLELNSTNLITILPRQDLKYIKNLEDESDVLVFLSNIQGSQIPGKIYQYFSTNKVILFILDGDIRQLKETFEVYNRVIFVENNKEAIENILKKLPFLKSNVINCPVEYFKSENISKKILESFD